MLWGTGIKEGKPFNTTSAFEDSEYPVLHISSCTLPQGKNSNKVYLTAKMGKELTNLTLGVLQRDKTDSLALDLYVHLSQGVTLSVSSGEVHLSGYFEPQGEGDDEAFFPGDEELESDEEAEEEGDEGMQKVAQHLKDAKKNALVNAALKEGESDEEDEEEEEEEEEEESEEIEIPQKKQKKQAPAKPQESKKKPAVVPVEESDDEEEEEDADDILADMSDDDEEEEDSEEIDIEQLMKAQKRKASHEKESSNKKQKQAAGPVPASKPAQKKEEPK